MTDGYVTRNPLTECKVGSKMEPTAFATNCARTQNLKNPTDTTGNYL